MGCSGKPAEEQPSAAAAAATEIAETPLEVLTTFYPTLYLTRRIGGDHVKVENLCPLDADPIFWMPDEAALTRYQKADMVVSNGAGYEQWLSRVNLPLGTVVDSASGFQDEHLMYKTAVVHTHGPGGAHTHEGIDGHTWLDPMNALRQARAIHKALIKRRPAHEADFDAGLARLTTDLTALDQAFRALSARLGDTPLMAAHPAYSYLGHRYGWRLENLDLDPGSHPTAAQMRGVAELRRRHPAQILLWESAPSSEVTVALDAQGITSVVFSPAEQLDPAGEADLLSVMHANLARLDKVIPKTAPTPPAPVAPAAARAEGAAQP